MANEPAVNVRCEMCDLVLVGPATPAVLGVSSVSWLFRRKDDEDEEEEEKKT